MRLTRGLSGRLLIADLDGVALDDKYLMDDGLHPNAAGVASIVEGILPKVEELLAYGRRDEPKPLIDQMRQIDPFNEEWARLAMRTEFFE